MKQKDKQLLLKDLCARLPHKVIVEIISYTDETSRPWFGELSCKDLDCFIHDVAYKSIKPYLRPMSSMTEEEKKRFDDFCVIDEFIFEGNSEIGHKNQAIIMSGGIDYLNSIHVDYRGLIPRGLAIAVIDENNPYKD